MNYNNFKATATKYHISYHPINLLMVQLLKWSYSQRLLGVAIDSSFSFEEHINNLSQKSTQGVCHCTEYHNIYRQTFVTSQINYCPIIWMYHDNTLNNRINNIHHMALKKVYQGKKPCSEKIMQKSKSFLLFFKYATGRPLSLYVQACTHVWRSNALIFELID